MTAKSGIGILTGSVIALASLLGLASPAQALIPDYSFSVGDSYYLGSVSPDGGSPAQEATEINNLLGVPLGTSQVIDSGQPIGSNTYTRSTTACAGCPTATSTGAVGETTGQNGGDNIGDFGSGYTYLVAKYDAGQAGGYVWYVGGLTGSFSVPLSAGTCGSSGCGLSHWELFNPSAVPEPATLLLIGTGMVGLGYARRKGWLHPRQEA